MPWTYTSRVIQNIAGYYGVLNTCPLPNMGSPENKKTITLILIDDTYHPVVNVPGQPPAVYRSIQQVSSDKCPVVLMGETPEKKQTTSSFVPETQVIPETQLVSTPKTPEPEIIPESPQSSQEVVFQNYEISPKKGKGTWEATKDLTKEVRSHQRRIPRNVFLFHQSQSQMKLTLHLLSFQLK